MPRHPRPTGGQADEPLVGGLSFDECYYARCCGRPYRRDAEWLAFFGKIADHIVSEIGPRRVLDAGCGLALLVEALRERDVAAWGIEISRFAIEHLHESTKQFCRLDSVTRELDDHYDLIVVIEVLEHMSTADGLSAIENFCDHSSDILFSSSPSDYKEPTHINVHPPEYWAEQFARHSFYRDVGFDASFLTPWAVRFRQRRDPAHRVVSDYERAYCRVAGERNDLRVQAIQTQAEISQLTAAQTDTLAERDRVRAERDQAIAERDQLRSGRDRLCTERDRAEADANRVRSNLLSTQHGLAQARATVTLMERSWFWRIRRLWVRVRRLFGRA